MGELPEGVELPLASVAIPRPSASLIISRNNSGKEEILLCHRVSEVPAFPDFWAFPGGGVSRVDRQVAEENPDWLSHTEDPVSTITLLRELVEEVGFAPDGEGSLELVDENMNPLAAQTDYVINRMKTFGILMSSDGPDHNVIKIKPPITFIHFTVFAPELSETFKIVCC